MLKLVTLSFVSFAVACSGTHVVVNQQTATAVTHEEMNTANTVSSFAQTTPPTNATSMGMMSKPQAGPTTIPIENVEVYTFQATLDNSSDTMFWAATSDVVYVWGQIALTCVDDNGTPTGETGNADFVYDAQSGGAYGWMTATDSCGYTTYFGCSGDTGGSETCGGCDFNSEFIACAAISS
jgi:hypothetical protein